MRRNTTFTLVWVGIATVLALAALEAGLRVHARYVRKGIEHFVLLQYGPMRPSAVPGLLVELDPTKSTPEVPIDAEGFRGGPLASPKPADAWRVALVGDSVVYGIALKQDETIPAITEQELRRLQREGRLPALAGKTIETINAGVPSYNAAQVLAAIDRKLPAAAPDAVVVVLTPNDYEGNGFVRFESAAARALFAHSHLYRAGIALAQKASRPTDAGIRDWRARNQAAIREIARRAHDDPGRVLIVLHPILTDRPPATYVTSYDEIARTVRDAGVIPLETRPLLVKRFGRLDGLSASAADIIHPAAPAASAIGEWIADAVARDVSGQRAR
jgi:lysophospholipase L1-like esterase